MLKRVLLLTTSAFLLACGAIGASAPKGRRHKSSSSNRSRSASYRAPKLRAALFKMISKTMVVIRGERSTILSI